MKILSAEQIRAADAHTIAHEPIASVDLMERASIAFVGHFRLLYPMDRKIHVYCGTGNNGGDGLVVTRLLREVGYDVSVFAIGNPEKTSPDFAINLKRLGAVQWIQEANFPELLPNSLVIDALFGSGLTRRIEGLVGDLIAHINSASVEVVALDIASGLFADTAPEAGSSIIEPRHTISFQVPKLAFFQPELASFVGRWHVVDIGLDAGFMDGLDTSYRALTRNEVIRVLPVRDRYMHKGRAGRVQLISGSYGKIGAAVLAAKAAMRSGVGLLFTQVPECARDVMHNSVAETMLLESHGDRLLTHMDIEENVDAVGIGPGLGTADETVQALERLLIENSTVRLVLDADALNSLSLHPTLIACLPPGTILTPHPGEFQRLVGPWKDDFDKLDRLRHFCQAHAVNMVLKGAFSAICDQEGNVTFNTTGNPGMATAGSGDVLLGILTALLGQGLEPVDALRLGVYAHGLAGDLAKCEKGELGLVASDLIEFLPKAWLNLRS